MKSFYPGLTEILNVNEGKMKCLICGEVWLANINRNTGKWFRGNQMCPKGCTKKALEKKEN